MLVSCRVFGGVLVEKKMIFHQHVFFFSKEPVFLSILNISCLLVYFLLSGVLNGILSYDIPLKIRSHRVGVSGSPEGARCTPKKLLMVEAPADQSWKN